MAAVLDGVNLAGGDDTAYYCSLPVVISRD